MRLTRPNVSSSVSGDEEHVSDEVPRYSLQEGNSSDEVSSQQLSVVDISNSNQRNDLLELPIVFPDVDLSEHTGQLRDMHIVSSNDYADTINTSNNFNRSIDSVSMNHQNNLYPLNDLYVPIGEHQEEAGSSNNAGLTISDPSSIAHLIRKTGNDYNPGTSYLMRLFKKMEVPWKRTAETIGTNSYLNAQQHNENSLKGRRSPRLDRFSEEERTFLNKSLQNFGNNTPAIEDVPFIMLCCALLMDMLNEILSLVDNERQRQDEEKMEKEKHNH